MFANCVDGCNNHLTSPEFPKLFSPKNPLWSQKIMTTFQSKTKTHKYIFEQDNFVWQAEGKDKGNNTCFLQ
jgi:hypothetical protein